LNNSLKCPFQPGTYHANNLLANFTGLPPIFETGEYMIHMDGFKDGAMVQSIQIYVTMINMVMGAGGNMIGGK
jgi:hypothetical protein